MTSAAESVARLGRIAVACRQGRPLEPADAIFLALGIDAVARGAAQSLDAALGLLPRPGQRRAGTEFARQHRDELLRAFAEAHFANMSRRAQAVAIVSAVRRHRTAPHHRDQDDAPGLIGQLAELTVPGPRQLQKILRAN